jgi:hypothetical protein
MVALLAIAVILSVDHYRDLIAPPILSDMLLYLVAPLLIITLIWRRSPLDFGLRFGHWRAGLAWTAGGIVLMAGVGWLFLQLPGFPSYYAGYFALHNPGGDVWTGIALSGVQMFGWEFLFRGFLLFALAEIFDADAVWIQMVPFAMAHFGKPEWETYASIPGGLLAGWIAYRVGAFWPAWLIHWALAISMHLLMGTL